MRAFRSICLQLTTVAGVAFAATGASAQGLEDRASVREGPHAPPPYIWTGLYIGAAAGYGFASTELSEASGESVELSLKGAQGTLSFGYDFQTSARTVLGVFADYAFGEIDSNFSGLGLAIDNQWALGVRLGWLATPSTLLHTSAGYTRAEFELSSAVLQLDKELDGFFVGLGAEQALTRSISLKLDYRFADYQDFRDGTLIIDNELHTVRVGLNWRFGRDDRAPVQ